MTNESFKDTGMFTTEHRQYTFTNDADMDCPFHIPGAPIYLKDYTMDDTILKVDFWGISFEICVNSKCVHESEEYPLD